MAGDEGPGISRKGRGWLRALLAFRSWPAWRKAAGMAPDVPRASLEAQWEVRDMGHVWVLPAGAVLYLGLAVLLGLLWSLQYALGHPPGPAGFHAAALPHAGDSATVMRFRARAPGLFPYPPADLKRFRAAQAAQAPRYGWVDRKAGVIGIPVERAMSRIVAAGWPHWEFPGVQGGPAAQPVAPREARDSAQAQRGGG
jgi:hypothetical protein